MENLENKNTAENSGNKSAVRNLTEDYLFTLFLALLSSIAIAYFVVQLGQYVFMQDLGALA